MCHAHHWAESPRQFNNILQLIISTRFIHEFKTISLVTVKEILAEQETYIGSERICTPAPTGLGATNRNQFDKSKPCIKIYSITKYAQKKSTSLTR